MRLPKTIHFSGFDYEIKEVNRLDGRGTWGRTQMDKQKIYIEKDMSDEKKMETLIHELLHIALRNTGLYDKKQSDEEPLIRAFSLNIFGILKDNGFLKL